MAFNPALTGIGVLGTSAIVGGGVAINGILNEDADIEEDIKASQNPELKIKTYEPQVGYVLVDDSKYLRDSTHKNTYVKKFEMSFMGIDTRIKEARLNDHGGKGAYKHSYRQDAEGGFSREIVSSGEKLKDACREAYKGTLEESTGLITYNNSKYKEEDVGNFCSGIHKKPSPIGDDEVYAADTIGAKNRSKLISTKGNKNFDLGDTRTHYVLSKDQKPPSDKDSKFFKKRYDEEKKNRAGNGTKPKDPLAVKKGCEEAYSLQSVTSSSDNQPTEDEVLKYCSIEDNYYDPVTPRSSS